MDNNIITRAKQKLIQLADVYGRSVRLPYQFRRGSPLSTYQAYTVMNDTVIYPQENLLVQVPPSMQCNAVNITLRKEFSFSNPRIENAKKGYVHIKN